MSNIKQVEFKDIDFETLNTGNISLEWTRFIGYSILVWQNKVGSANNTILYESILPKSLHQAFVNYIRNEGYTRKMTLADY